MCIAIRTYRPGCRVAYLALDFTAVCIVVCAKKYDSIFVGLIVRV